MMAVVAEREGSQFVISVGDNFYEEGLAGADDPMFTQSFTDIYTAKSLQRQWHLVLGNHDYYGNALAQLDPALRTRDFRWFLQRSYVLKKSLCGILEGICLSSEAMNLESSCMGTGEAAHWNQQ
eukprot:SM005233S17869  [mRNA]  locus=s5233:179:937:- [translate_table: standard]